MYIRVCFYNACRLRRPALSIYAHTRTSWPTLFLFCVQANQIKRSGDRQKVEKLRAGMANCREAIIDMCKIMHVTFVDDRARVVALSDTDESYWSGLCNRTCS